MQLQLHVPQHRRECAQHRHAGGTAQAHDGQARPRRQRRPPAPGHDRHPQRLPAGGAALPVREGGQLQAVPLLRVGAAGGRALLRLPRERRRMPPQVRAGAGGGRLRHARAMPTRALAEAARRHRPASVQRRHPQQLAAAVRVPPVHRDLPCSGRSRRVPPDQGEVGSGAVRGRHARHHDRRRPRLHVRAGDQPDAQKYDQLAQSRLGEIIAGSHHTTRYIPVDGALPNANPPVPKDGWDY